MKAGILLFVVLFTVALSTTAMAQHFWFNINSASITQLDIDSYQLRVTENWGPLNPPPEWDYWSLHILQLDPLLGDSQYNPTWSNGLFSFPGYWEAGGRSSLYGPFGYDFDTPIAPGPYPIQMSYFAYIWAFDEPEGGGLPELFQEYYSGTFYVNPVPEPTTLLSLGLVLVGASWRLLRAKNRHRDGLLPRIRRR